MNENNNFPFLQHFLTSTMETNTSKLHNLLPQNEHHILFNKMKINLALLTRCCSIYVCAVKINAQKSCYRKRGSLKALQIASEANFPAVFFFATLVADKK
jgi:hypothetical protein